MTEILVLSTFVKIFPIKNNYFSAQRTKEFSALLPPYKFCFDSYLTFNFPTLAYFYDRSFYSRQNQEKFGKTFGR